jgi:hypothetical protein
MNIIQLQDHMIRSTNLIEDNRETLSNATIIVPNLLYEINEKEKSILDLIPNISENVVTQNQISMTEIKEEPQEIQKQICTQTSINTSQYLIMQKTVNNDIFQNFNQLKVMMQGDIDNSLGKLGDLLEQGKTNRGKILCSIGTGNEYLRDSITRMICEQNNSNTEKIMNTYNSSLISLGEKLWGNPMKI